ncbi:MAG: NPCBM/NEW2 domain-containing protein [Lentisphaeria bacterium]|jgi:parallel beta-helix repeat protein|nr:NPCBM/NEW2 domain-containing protein [Lentisphaeria bacterium]
MMKFWMAIGIMAMTAGAAEFWVSPNGDDGAAGTEAAPFRTLERTREAWRGLPPAARQEGVTVWLRGGTYELASTFALTEPDSGTAGAPTVIRAVPGERPRLSGGRTLPAAGFVPVADPQIVARVDAAARGGLLVCDLQAQGIAEFGTLDRGALNGGPMLEVFFNGRALPLSRWPNGREWATYGQVVDAGSVPRWNEKPDRPGTFEYLGDRPRRWLAAPEVWLHGYWAFDWYDDVLKVATHDPETRRITFTTPHTYGLKAGRRFAAVNLLEEIDQPGEWMLDRESGRLYLLPPGDMAGAEIVVSMLAAPLLSLEKTRFVVVRDLVFEYGRGQGVQIRGGTDNLIAGCIIRNLGTSAVGIGPVATAQRGQLTIETGDELVDGRRNGVAACDIHDVGTSGITLNGGDRASLTPAGHYAENNDIHHYSRRKRTGCPAVGLGGVGNRASRNFVHDAPHCGINYGGNDHLIEYNEIARLCWETGDVGAIYSGRDWTTRGNMVRHNFIYETLAPGQVGSMGVYLDDSHSSTAIVGNVFYKCDYAAFIGGGHDNLVENNIFVDCNKAVHLDNRSQGWANKYQVRGGDHRMYEKLEDVRHDQPPYSVRYPELARILEGDPHLPTGNRALRNVCVGGVTWLHLFPGAEKVMEIRDNLVTRDDPGFVDAARLNFALRPDSRVFREVPGFQPIPFAEIGLRQDEYRKALPVRAPRIVPGGGVFSDPVAVTLQTDRPDGAIHYTLDGSDPSRRSPRYTEPLPITASVTVNAVVYPLDDPAARPSPQASAQFTYVVFGQGQGVYLSDIEPESSQVHGGLVKDQNYRRNDFLTLSGTVHRKGLLIHPLRTDAGVFGEAVYSLEPPLHRATRFRATVGIDDGGDQRGSASFRVDLFRNGEWETAFQSPVLHGRPKEDQVEVDVELRGAGKIRLFVDGAGDASADHAAWGSARLE